MTKKRDLIKNINRAAREAGLEFKQKQRKGGRHDVYDLNGETIAIPRHNEINELTTLSIYKQAAHQLGKDWWK
ncbi:MULTISPECIES: hypothetical protein [Rothia]|uniref:hypothetical protein n=1 Tax=Rothia TaxID=32207 RepID=UPI001F2EF11C|nr:hypothetical protein [Rothia nasimurium]